MAGNRMRDDLAENVESSNCIHGACRRMSLTLYSRVVQIPLKCWLELSEVVEIAQHSAERGTTEFCSAMSSVTANLFEMVRKLLPFVDGLSLG
jgi:hypothetical protein